MAEAAYCSRSPSRSPKPNARSGEAPHIETEADLLEGLQYLAWCVAACTHIAFDYDRDHLPAVRHRPVHQDGSGQSRHLYFGTRVRAGHEYVVTGRRGTTTDLSFQILGGEYTDANVPGQRDGFRRPPARHRPGRELRMAVHPGEQRTTGHPWCTTTGRRSAGTSPSPAPTPPAPPAAVDQRAHRKRWATAGKQLVQRVKTWLQFPRWFYLNIPVNTITAPG